MMLALTFATYAVTLNGQPVLPHARAAVVNGRVLLPVRALGEALGADVTYDATERRIVVQRGARVATLPSHGAVRIVAGHAYAPLRAVATAFDFAVAYSASTRTVALDDSHSAGGDAGPRGSLPAPAATVSARTYRISTAPSDGADVHEPYPSIAARFSGVASIDRHSLRFFIDGRDVGDDAAVIGDQIFYTPRTALTPGRHDVRVTATASGGVPLAAAWSFNDTFAFVAPPPPPPPPVTAIYIDRWVAPGTTAFDVVVRGVPGLTGFVGVDGIAGIFPLVVFTYDSYVAHVIVPSGMNEPFARVAARITLPNGIPETIVLPQTIGLFTPPAPPAPTPTPTPTPKPTPTAAPVKRPLPAASTTPSSAPTPMPRRILRITPSPSPALNPTASPSPSPTPKPRPRPRPSITPVPPAAAQPQ